jgi:nucleotide-binding universal stress UspA family protein
MTVIDAGTRVALKNILYLTDFSSASESALPFARTIARVHKSNVHVFHVMIPEPMACSTPETTAAIIEAQQEEARTGIDKIEGQLAGLPLNSIAERGMNVWLSVKRAIREYGIDLVVLGTHGRTGAKKFFLGSVAEEIFRRSPVPVLTVGPSVRRGAEKGEAFSRILLATDFLPESVAATPYAIYLAQESHAALIALHVIRRHDKDEKAEKESMSTAMSSLQALFPASAKSRCQLETVVCYGNPAEKIIQIAEQRGVDLIVSGVHSRGRSVGVATHLERNTTHNVIVQARCPVLTVPS